MCLVSNFADTMLYYYKKKQITSRRGERLVPFMQCHLPHCIRTTWFHYHLGLAELLVINRWRDLNKFYSDRFRNYLHQKIVSYWNKTYLFAANVVISAALSRVVRTSSQLLPPVIRCTELNETSSLEFFPLFATLLLDGAILCLDACLWRLSAKNSARTAFSFASLISTAVTCSNPWTFCAWRKSRQHCTFSNCK